MASSTCFLDLKRNLCAHRFEQNLERLGCCAKYFSPQSEHSNSNKGRLFLFSFNQTFRQSIEQVSVFMYLLIVNFSSQMRQVRSSLSTPLSNLAFCTQLSLQYLGSVLWLDLKSFLQNVQVYVLNLLSLHRFFNLLDNTSLPFLERCHSWSFSLFKDIFTDRKSLLCFAWRRK